LAVESSGRAPGVALLKGGELLVEERGAAGRTGAESLLPCVDAVLRRAGVSLEAVEAFAVSIGPGSFTGLRVGVATVKGLAFATGRPVAPVPTLAALARGAAPGAAGAVVALLDARRGELYAATWVLEGPGAALREGEPREAVYTPEELGPRLPAECLLVGEGVPLAADRLRALGGPGVRPGPALAPRAADVGVLGLRILSETGGVDAAELTPRYLRRAEAEVKRTGERFEPRA
jgi:tRNA threonylcarbamoyladenosine biosynthesis protein TsaB